MATELPGGTEKLIESRIVSQPSASRTRLEIFSTIMAVMNLLVAWVFSLAVILTGQAAYAQSPPAGAGPILVIGDSLSAEYGLKRGSGWVALMAARLTGEQPPKAVVNASISGETTAGGRSRVNELLEKHKPAWVLIELGANDALRGLDLVGTEANLRAMTQAARKAGAQVMIIGMMVPPNYGKTYAQQFVAMFERVAKAEGVALTPFLLDGIGERLEFFQSDRIHPNEAAQQRMFENVWTVLQPRLLAKAAK